MKHIHILGIGGTFMAGLAAIAREQGYRVTGCDTQLYPPMSTQLESLGIEVITGFDVSQLTFKADCYVIGNAMKRGNPLVEAILNQNLKYQSGPEWLAQQCLKDRWVIAVAGTHGKTTTTSLVTWILEYAGLKPGYLLGGIAQNFPTSARLGEDPFFVIEADEYDSAFFDKRSKFIHYKPRTLVLNNLEFDHADIFRDLSDIERQFHHLVRTVPQHGLILYPQQDEALARVIAAGCWTPTLTFAEGGEWQCQPETASHQRFSVLHAGEKVAEVDWSLLGEHNSHNALAALLAARHAGVSLSVGCAALATYQGVKRRMEVIGNPRGITVYDDFAHHPTAVATTLKGLRAKVGSARIIAVLELGSYTMRAGVHGVSLLSSLEPADHVFLAQCRKPNDEKNEVLGTQPIFQDMPALQQAVTQAAQPGDHLLIMSNTGFQGFQKNVLEALAV